MGRTAGARPRPGRRVGGGRPCRRRWTPAERALLHGRIRLSRAVLEQNAGSAGRRRAAATGRCWPRAGSTSAAPSSRRTTSPCCSRSGARSTRRCAGRTSRCDLLRPGARAARAGHPDPGVDRGAGRAAARGHARLRPRGAGVHATPAIPLGEYYTEYADAMTDLRLLPEAAAAAADAVDEFDAAGAPLMVTEAQLRLARIALLDRRPRRGAAARRTRRPTVRAANAGPAGGTGRSSSAVEARLRVAERSAPPSATRRGGPRAGSSGPGNLHERRRGVPGRGPGGARRSERAPRRGARARPRARRSPVTGRSWCGCRGRLAGALAARAAHDARRRRWPSAARVCGTSPSTARRCRRSSCARWRPVTVPSSARSAWGSSWRGARRPRRWPGWSGRGQRRCSRGSRRRDAPLAERDASDVGTAGTGRERGRPAATGRRVDGCRAADWSHGRAASDARGSVRRPRAGRDSATALDGRTLVEFGTFEGRLVAVVVDPRRARLVELGAEQDVVTELRPLLFALRRLANPRGGAAAEPPGPAPTCASPGCVRCCRAAGRRPRRRAGRRPGRRAARRAVVVPARRPARPGAVGHVLGAHARRRRRRGTAAAGRSSWRVRT